VKTTEFPFWGAFDLGWRVEPIHTASDRDPCPCLGRCAPRRMTAAEPCPTPGSHAPQWQARQQRRHVPTPGGQY